MQELDDIFRIWPSIKDMADDINQLPDTVSRWKLRRRIPEDAWPKIIERAAAREQLVTASQIMKLNAPILRRGRPRQNCQA
jgi:hypothetical protein